MAQLYTSRCRIVNTLRCLTISLGGYTFPSMSLANRIKASREHAGLTQIGLSKKISLPQQTISKLENGLQQETAALVKIATACGVDPVWLDSGEGEMLKYSNEDLIAVEIAHKLSVHERRAWYRAGRALAEPDEGTNCKQ